ncbi:carboxylesterase family protein [Streptomyces sp. NPDC001634]|uniref:carboxylesterase family protein n=1 Tax=Streptomyces sp. NPDC001634 TaxID=3154390 RepID=UPI00331FE6F8
MIVVSVDYRLGAFGCLRSTGIPEGNLGVSDQLAALRWVRDGIASFGGAHRPCHPGRPARERPQRAVPAGHARDRGPVPRCHREQHLGRAEPRRGRPCQARRRAFPLPARHESA